MPLTAAELRCARDRLALSVQDLAEITGRGARAYRTSEGGRRPVNPIVVDAVTELEDLVIAAADERGTDAALVRYLDQDAYLRSGQPAHGLSDYRLHAAALTRTVNRGYEDVADEAFTARVLRWDSPGRRHDDATLRFLRDATGTTIDWLAVRTSRNPHNLQRMEEGDDPIQDEVTEALLDLRADMEAYSRHILDREDVTIGPVVLARYRDDTDLAENGHLEHAGLAAIDQQPRLTAVAHGLASLRAAETLRSHGRDVRIRWADQLHA